MKKDKWRKIFPAFRKIFHFHLENTKKVIKRELRKNISEDKKNSKPIKKRDSYSQGQIRSILETLLDAESLKKFLESFTHVNFILSIYGQKKNPRSDNINNLPHIQKDLEDIIISFSSQNGSDAEEIIDSEPSPNENIDLADKCLFIPSQTDEIFHDYDISGHN